MAQNIPKEQSAYQPGRSTSEQVLAVKLMAEKAINENNGETYLALFDMSKAFDTVNREILFNHLERILNPDELHLLSMLTNRPIIKVKVKEELGRDFNTEIGIMQGDCLSAIFFIFYLSKSLGEETTTTANSKYLIKPKYADDITYITNDKETYNKLNNEVPSLLQRNDLKLNTSKTERYTIPKPPPPTPPPPTFEEITNHKDDKPCWSELDWLVHYVPTPPVTSY